MIFCNTLEGKRLVAILARDRVEMPPFHHKARHVEFGVGNEKEVYMQQLMYKIEKQDNRNVRRQNAKLIRQIETMLHQSPSACISWNIAEVFYNGVPGIPANFASCMEYYVKAWEAMAHGETIDPLLPFLMNNMREVYDCLDIDDLNKFAVRLHRASEAKRLPQLELLATLFSGRVADLRSQRADAIELYRSAKAIAMSIGDSESVLECSRKKGLLKAFGQAEVDKVAKSYRKRHEKVLYDKLLTEPGFLGMTQHITPGKAARKVYRGYVDFGTPLRQADVEEMLKLSGLDATASPARECFECGKVEHKHGFQCCTGCFKTWYCSRKCQKAHWKQHKDVCSANRIGVPRT